MAEKLRVAAVQMTSRADKAANLERAETLVGYEDDAANRGVSRISDAGEEPATARRYEVRSMAIDEAPYGVRVNAVCPGSVDTPMLRASAT